MPKDLKDFPRPSGDNGRGLYCIAATGWSGSKEGYDPWIGELATMGIKWLKVLDDRGDSLPLCEKLLAVGIFPIVRIIRKDPPPNDSPEPNPGHINAAEEETIRRLIAAGVRYFETNNEPNVGAEWKHGALPGDLFETAKLVALNWLFDARFILNAGGLPGLPAISVGDDMDLMGALVALGRHDILLEGCWIALHNYCLNHPLDYPDDTVNRNGQLLTEKQYDQGAYTQWVWWNSALGRADTLAEVNDVRATDVSPSETIHQDHACFREFEYYNALAMKYLGRSIPILSTEGGMRVGRREDPRYPRITPEVHRDRTIALFDFMQRQAPDYYFAAVPSVWLESAGREADAWRSSFWQRALKSGTDGQNGIPPMPVRGITLSDQLPVIDAVKQMPILARRLPGIQPTPPVDRSIKTEPVKPTRPPHPAPPPKEEKKKSTVERPGLAVLLSEAPPAPSAAAVTPPPAPAPTTAPVTPPPTSTPTPPPMAPPHIAPRAPAPFPAAEPKPSAAPAVPSPTPRAPAPSPVAAPPPSAAPAAPSPKPRAPTPPSVAAPKPGAAPAAPSPMPRAPTPPPVAAPEPSAPPAVPSPMPRAPTPPPVAAPRLAPSAVAKTRPTQAPIPKPPKMPLGETELEWDFRLDALNLTVDPANVAPGEQYWQLVRAVYEGPDESCGTHHIYYNVLDEDGEPIAGQKVWQGWAEDKTYATTNDRGQTNIGLWLPYAPDRGESGPYFAWVDGLPSDSVCGMGLPLKRHVNFLLTWQRATK